MPAIVCSLGALVVASIFYGWRSHYEAHMKLDKQLRERVVFMLWAAATKVS